MLKNISTARVLPLTCILILFFCGCKKFVEIDPPPTQIEEKVIFESDQGAISAVTGLYSKMLQNNLFIMSGSATIYPGLSADELVNTVFDGDTEFFTSNSLVVNNGSGIYARLWRSGYQNIYQANAILEGLLTSVSITDSIKSQLAGEMLVVRALNYFYLANFYGDVPYIDHTDYIINQSMPRTPVQTIYENLIKDLKRAKDLLKTTYPSINRTRPNKWTASALLARLYLYQKDWVNAESESSAVIQSNNYSLVTLLNNVFIIGSTETIWQLARDNNNTGEGGTFVPLLNTLRPTYYLTQTLLNAFENNDKRKTNWLAKSTVSGIDYYYPYKYRIRVATPITEYYIIFRLAEQYLIRAEARTMQNNVFGARSDIDMIRIRAGIPATTAVAQPTLLLAIEKERQIELFAEWGHRWMDIIRWGKADQVFGFVKSPNWQSTDVLYPIPLHEIVSNPFLIQNPGY